ncbi:signal recognition particle-docking protein FtsY [candidate division KSB1 bacterium]|nr:MAG: signal recognition particle-docking protein FtsY [candidate division KSB1 bacterium]MBC6949962.1 signal recognition particle-docking protein FtsY [candidate division KSB1 bacterium]MCE7944771.1 signal recognition particle-docking protein FtsY [Chlorobi bacterium CHB1]MDL1874637.1 signal recognition particle-docking protein FtsY [Cytophagia bacterium CHB2]
MASFFEKLKSGLSKTRRSLVDNVVQAVTGKARLDQALVDELESLLISADLGVAMTTAFLERLRERLGFGQRASREAVLDCLKEFLVERLESTTNGKWSGTADFFSPSQRPYVLMIVGVNGVGKTTTIAKLAHVFRQRGRSVLVAAADTFRAAAADQLEIWAKRAQVEIIKTKAGGDPSAVVFDALTAANSRQTDIVIVDTAGRLHTKSNLMEELKKMMRVMKRVLPEAPHEVLLVLDANTGQNGLRQAQAFFETAGVTGLIVTKLDGTAKGGIIFAIQEQLKIPVRFIGVGEGMDDLQPFEPEAFIEALFA